MQRYCIVLYCIASQRIASHHFALHCKYVPLALTRFTLVRRILFKGKMQNLIKFYLNKLRAVTLTPDGIYLLPIKIVWGLNLFIIIII